MNRIGWLDASSGISGDMLLGACADAGVPLGVMRHAIDSLGLPDRIRLREETVLRSGIGAVRVHVDVSESRHVRQLDDIVTLLTALEAPVRAKAEAAFRLLAAAEAAVHRVSPSAVHFHEIGALDSIADVVGAAAAMAWLDLDELVCAPIAVGGGYARTEHGVLPVPPPAVVELLLQGGAPAYGGPAERELATPTGVALAVAFAQRFGPMPALVTEASGTGAGAWDAPDHANVVRLLIGRSVDIDQAPPEAISTEAGLGVRGEPVRLLSANVDDLDPRLWPRILAKLMAAGADDAWLTPIIMKKGRPAHTVSVLAPEPAAPALARVLVTDSTTIGLRSSSVEKYPLPRETATVTVDGMQIRVKVALLDGSVVNVTPEYEDVARAALALDRPEKVVLAAATEAAARDWWR